MGATCRIGGLGHRCQTAQGVAVKVRGLLLAMTALATASALPASAGGSVALSPGQTASIKGHLQGVSPTGPVYAPGAADVCISNACDVTTVKLRLPAGRRGDLTVNAVAGATVVGLTIRVFDVTGQLLGSNTAGGTAVTATPSQGAQAVVRGLSAASYTVQLSVGAGTADFTETLKLAVAR
ncbi:MAG: hypothetical protein JWP11_852 [Frankiales bacterium]|nr:hypothetical protein [Frankiales bacterium]